jgi:hypothetical protein
MKFILVVLQAWALASVCHGVTIVGYDPVAHDRYTSGYPGSPVVNSSSSFVGAGYDFSGVGWDTALPNRSVTLISDQYFVYSGHYAVEGNISFQGTDGIVRTYVVDTSYQFAPAAGVGDAIGDLRVGRLLGPVDATIASYAILDLPQESDYTDLPLLVYGHGSGGSPRIGVNTIDGLLEVDVSGTTYRGLVYDQDVGVMGEALLESGDSGSPLFVSWEGGLALVGTHYGVGSDYSVDDFLPWYLAAMEAGNVPFSTVPEPGRGLLLVLAILGVCGRRTRRQDL